MVRVNTVLVVGSGLMGSGIAATSALAGHRTILSNRSLERAQIGYGDACVCIDELCANDLATSEQAGKAKELIQPSGDTLAAARMASLVIEAVPENLELKQRIFQELDQVLAPEVPILSNTSGLRITEIARYTQHPERTLTAHFWFPAHLIPLVEVVVGDHSSYELAVQVKEELLGWGKVAIIVKKDLPGQLANRVLQAVIREAVNIVEMGLAEPEEVDLAIKMGMGIRFPVWGPLEHIDAVGLDLGLSVQEQVLPVISASTEAAADLKALVAAGNLGHKTGQGFYDWDKKSMPALVKRRNDFVINTLKFFRDHQSQDEV